MINYLPGRVYLCDVRNANLLYCPTMIQWFALHGLDWREFKREGLPFDTLLATGDKMALDAVDQAKLREAGGL